MYSLSVHMYGNFVHLGNDTVCLYSYITFYCDNVHLLYSDSGHMYNESVNLYSNIVHLNSDSVQPVINRVYLHSNGIHLYRDSVHLYKNSVHLYTNGGDSTATDTRTGIQAFGKY